MSELPEDQMKDFIALTEELLRSYARVTRPETMIIESVEEPIEEHFEHPILSEARDLVFKMRSFMEDASGGEYAMGVENGMQRAADMIENLIRRHEKGDGFEQH